MKIALYKPTSIVDKIICFLSRGEYSHASIITSEGVLYESKSFGGVRKHPSIEDSIKRDYTIHFFDLRVFG